MNHDERKSKVQRINIENFLLVLIIVVLFISIGINSENKEYIKKGYDKLPNDVEQSIRKRALFGAWVFFIAGVYFLYSAFKDYQEEKSMARLDFTIAAAVVLIAAAIRIYTLYKYANVQISGSEDYAL